MKKLLQYKVQFFSLILLMSIMSMAMSQVYHIGDVIVNPDNSRGVVFYIHPDGSGGWMVALHDEVNLAYDSNYCAWGSCGDIPNLTNYRIDHVYELLADMNGYTNTQIIRNFQANETNWYAADTVDFENGWYLPSTGQLAKLFAACPFIAKALIDAGGEPMWNHWYWTSTEKNSEAVWRMKYGACNSIGKNEVAAAVRAVHDFTVNNTVFDTVMTYMWNTGETTDQIDMMPDSTTVYSVTATTGYGCSNNMDQNLVVNAPEPLIILDTICEGEAYHAHGFNVDGSQTINNDEIILDQTFQNNYGCDSIVTLKLYVEDTSASIIALNAFCDDFQTELMVNSSFTDYSWNTGATTPTIEVNLPGTYSVTASGVKCSAVAEYDVADCAFELYLPNTITPTNTDGLNDYFSITSRQQNQMTDFEIKIFNRFGQCVFQSKDKDFKWHGDFNGKTQKDAVYNYVIRCSTWPDKKHLFKGSIVVL